MFIDEIITFWAQIIVFSNGMFISSLYKINIYSIDQNMALEHLGLKVWLLLHPLGLCQWSHGAEAYDLDMKNMKSSLLYVSSLCLAIDFM